MDNRRIAAQLVRLARHLLAADRNAVRGDPKWIRAKYPGVADDGTPFKRGDKVLYWPRDKTFMVGKKAEQAWRDFQAQAADEAFMQSQFRH